MELLFLDIYMKELNGMETARRIRELECKVPIVFLTSSRDFAVESYEEEKILHVRSDLHLLSECRN